MHLGKMHIVIVVLIIHNIASSLAAYTEQVSFKIWQTDQLIKIKWKLQVFNFDIRMRKIPLALHFMSALKRLPWMHIYAANKIEETISLDFNQSLVNIIRNSVKTVSPDGCDIWCVWAFVKGHRISTAQDFGTLHLGFTFDMQAMPPLRRNWKKTN